eukprot:scaffold7280_cov61-Cylindrotheca_fusiformis.AAC.1
MAASLELPSLQEELFWKWPTLKDSKGSSEYGSDGSSSPWQSQNNKSTLRNSNFQEQEKLCDIAGNGPDP